MAASVNIELRRTSAKILEQMSTNPQNHPKLLSEGTLEKLAPLLSEEDDLRYNCFSIICNMSDTDDARIPISTFVGVKHIVESAESGETKIIMLSARILHNLSETLPIQDEIAQGPILDYIISLYNFIEEENQDVLNRIFVNLIQQEKNRAVVASRGIQPIIAILRVTNHATTPKLTTWGIQGLTEIASHGDQEREMIMRIGGIPPILRVLSDIERLPNPLLYAICRCMSVLSQSREVSRYLEKAQLLSYLVDGMKIVKDQKVTLSLLHATESIMKNSQNTSVDFVNFGGIGLVSSIDRNFRTDEKIQTSIDAILNHAASCDVNKPNIVEQKTHRPYFGVIRVFENATLITWALQALALLAEIGEKRAEILHSDGTDLLISALQTSKLSVESRTYAIRCLGTLAENALQVQGSIIAKATWAPFIESLSIRNSRLEEECTRTTRILLENELNHSGFANSKGFHKLKKIPINAQTARHLAMILNVLSDNEKLRTTVITEGGLKLMVQIASTKEPDVEQYIDSAISSLASRSENRELILEAIQSNARNKSGWMRLLTSIVHSSVRNEDVYHWIALSLIRFAEDASIHPIFFEEDGLPALELLATCRYPSVQMLGTRALRILAGARGAHQLQRIIILKK